MVIHISQGEVRSNGISHEEVAEFERQYGLAFPDGYSDLVVGFGQGVLSAHFSDLDPMDLARIYRPSEIERHVEEFRERWSTYWAWEDPVRGLQKDDFAKGFCFADTLDGDEAVILPGPEARVVILPRDFDALAVVSFSIDATVEYFSETLYGLPDIVGYGYELL